MAPRTRLMASFIAALVCVAACSALPQAPRELAQAVVGLACAALAGALVAPRRLPDARRLWGWALYLLAVGAVGGVASGAWAAGPVGLGALAALALSCVLAALFEEGVFRALAFEALRRAFGADVHAALKAAATSAALFGLVHVSVGDAASAQGAVEWAQLLLKPLQAALFGLCMAAAYERLGSVWPLVALHALFDVAYLGPVAQATYVTGVMADLVAVALTCALLVPGALAAARSLLEKREPAPHEDAAGGRRRSWMDAPRRGRGK